MNKKVLIIDDDNSILDAITMILEDEGYIVESAYRADETFNRIKTFQPDLILMDILISGLDGRVICKQLKNDTNTQNIPVIMISAHPSAEQGAASNGADGFLAKPFEAEDLLNIIAAQIS